MPVSIARLALLLAILLLTNGWTRPQGATLYEITASSRPSTAFRRGPLAPVSGNSSPAYNISASDAPTTPSVSLRGAIAGASYKNDVSQPLTSIPPIHPAPSAPHNRNERPPVPARDAQGAGVEDPVVQRSAGPLTMPAPSVSFAGIGYFDSDCFCAPPDTNGDVGPNHYVQTVNVAFAVWNKSGTLLYGPAAINTIWSGFGGACEINNDGDPVVVYDSIADRWLISQFTASSPYNECIAVSTTGDPTGSYYRYAFALSSSDFPDYPKFGVWPDGYYMTTVQFNGGSVYAGPRPYVFDRARMLAGLSATYQSFPALGSFADPMLPADLDGSTLPPSGASNYFAEFGTTLSLYKFHVDWTTPANSTFTNYANLATAGFTELCPTTGSCISQPGTAQKLDGLGDRLMHRLVYRNFSDHEALLLSHSVNVGTNQAGVRWYEVRSPNASPVIYQQSSYAPDTTSRWMGSVAMDHDGNLAIGYSASSSSVYPSIRYAGRLATDPLNSLAQGEATLWTGTGVQSGTNRWGDYSNLSVDPADDCTFWFTSEYNNSTNWYWGTRIGSFKLPSCSSNGTPVPTSPPTNTPTNTATRTPTNTATRVPTKTPSLTPSSTATRTPTNTSTPTLTATNTPTVTDTPVPTATDTPAPTATDTSLPPATDTPPATASDTAAPTATPTTELQPSSTPVPPVTDTPAPTATDTPAPTATDTSLPPATDTPLATASDTAVPTATASNTPVATDTPVPTATEPPAATASDTARPTNTSSPTATATDTLRPSNTPSSTPTTTPSAGGNVLLNPGFESGPGVGWSEFSSGGFELINRVLPHAGAYSAYECGYNSCTEYLQQSVTIPNSASLSFWWYLSSTDSTTVAHDYLKVELYNSNGTLLQTLRTRNNLVQRNVWKQDTIDLSARAGQTVILRITTTTDSSLPSNFVLDDTSIAGPTPVNTPTFTPTVAPSNTSAATATASHTAQPSNTPTLAPTNTPIDTAAATNTTQPSNTPTSLPTNTVAATATATATAPATATNSPVPSNTPANTPIPTATISNLQSLLNGNFESGPGVGWSESSSGGFEIINGLAPHSGLYSANECGYNSCTEYLQQSVTILNSASLSFWWYLSSTDSTTVAHDYLKVELYNSNGTLLQTLRTRNNLVQRNVWKQDTIDLSARAGQTVILRITTTTDSSLPSNFVLDDVTITGPAPVNTATPTATVTLSPTPTPTLTATTGATRTATPTSTNTATPTVMATNPPTLTATTGPTRTATPISTNTSTPTSTLTPTRTSTSTPTSTPQSPLSNGDFESGPGVGWSESSSGGFEIITSLLPHAGVYSAYECGYNSCTEYVQQPVTIPSAASLTFWWYMTSQDSATTARDYFKVELYRPDGTLLVTLRTRNNTVRRDSWVQDTISLSSYAGQTLTLRLTTTTDGTNPTSFYVDDVAIR